MGDARRVNRILLVEDNPGDARIVRELLAEAKTGAELVHAERLADGTARLAESHFDVVLLDLSLPDSSGRDTVARAKAVSAAIPIVVMTGLDDEEMAVTALREGAQDYLVKGQFDSRLLVRAVRYAIERKRQEQELERKNRELERLSELKNQFLGMAAHDLRNPLTVILSASGFLLEEAAAALTPEMRNEFLRRIKTNSEFMVRLIDDLLDFARIESEEIELQLQPLDITDLVSRNVEQNARLAQQKGIRVAFESDNSPLKVTADPGRVEQVLNNLITNAVKFSTPGASVTVRAGPQNGRVVISVADQGPGIPAEEMGKLFRPFGRTSVRPTAGEKSTGLGLAICRRIVEAHQGQIWAESEPGRGSVFAFALPSAGREVQS